MAVLTPQSFIELATNSVLIRIWKKGKALTIELVSLGKRAEPPPPLVHVCYKVDIPLNEEKPFLEIRPTISVDKTNGWIEGAAQAILDAWKEHSLDLCMNFHVFACHILTGKIARRPVRMPEGCLDLILHYIRLSSLLNARLESEYDGSLTALLYRFNSFIQQQIKELKRLGTMLES